jgi:hydrophobic/amphiphilic exporter-1 (mainly G- bacteria), HAE1 family
MTEFQTPNHAAESLQASVAEEKTPRSKTPWLLGLGAVLLLGGGLVMLIGLASKNSILIVEFANQLRQQGFSIPKAAIEASQERLRLILMTAISTLVGIFQLAIATGAGAGSRQSLGTAVFGGMLLATFLSLFVVPVLYVIVVSLSDRLLHRFHPNRTDI